MHVTPPSPSPGATATGIGLCFIPHAPSTRRDRGEQNSFADVQLPDVDCASIRIGEPSEQQGHEKLHSNCIARFRASLITFVINELKASANESGARFLYFNRLRTAALEYYFCSLILGSQSDSPTFVQVHGGSATARRNHCTPLAKMLSVARMKWPNAHGVSIALGSTQKDPHAVFTTMEALVAELSQPGVAENAPAIRSYTVPDDDVIRSAVDARVLASTAVQEYRCLLQPRGSCRNLSTMRS